MFAPPGGEAAAAPAREAAAPAQASAPPPDPDAPSAGQSLVSELSEAWLGLTRLDPSEVAINLVLSVLVVVLVAGAVWGLRRALHALVRRLAPGHTPADAAPRIAGVTWALVRLAALAAGAAAVLAVWGVDLWGWLTDGPGQVVARLALIVLLAAAVVEVAGFAIGRALRAAEKRSAGPRAAQLRTLAPLLRGFVQVVVVSLAAITALAELGVQIAPLLASAGVAGIALGFGAQTLVKDFLTGLFLIIEDVVAVGDNVRIGDRSGVVEAMTLRTIRLRNLDGTLHILPYSEAQVIDNRTKAFSSYVVEVGVAYDTDVDHAFSVMRRVGDELRADPAFGPVIEAPVEIFGLDGFGDNALMLKARLRTAPGEQWRVGRAYNRALKAAFDAEGIAFPFPQRTLSLDPALAEAVKPALGALAEARANGGLDPRREGRPAAPGRSG